jgi:hypothetical protein
LSGVSFPLVCLKIEDSISDTLSMSIVDSFILQTSVIEDSISDTLSMSIVDSFILQTSVNTLLILEVFHQGDNGFSLSNRIHRNHKFSNKLFSSPT